MQTSGHRGFSVTAVILGTIFSCLQFPTVCGAIITNCTVCLLSPKVADRPPVPGGDFPLHCIAPFLSPGLFGLVFNWGLGSCYLPDLPSSHCHSFYALEPYLSILQSPASLHCQPRPRCLPVHLAFPKWASHSMLVLASFLPLNLSGE